MSQVYGSFLQWDHAAKPVMWPFISENSAQQLILDPKLYTEVVPVKPKQEPAPAKKEQKPIVIRASICCSPCAGLIEYEIKQLKGVKTVECEVNKHKVTVTGDLSVADVLMAARKNFKDAELYD